MYEQRNYDFVAIYADKERKNMLAGKFSGRKSSSEKNWPGVGDRPSLIFEDRHDCWISFITDGSNTDWGWRLTVSPLAPAGVQDKSLSDLTVRPIPTAADKVEPGSRVLSLETYLASPSSGIALVEFGEGLTRPSLSVALALFDLLLDAAVTAEFLFETDTGCAILTNLSQCAGAIGDSQPWLARTFFDIVTRITLLYRHYRKSQGSDESYNFLSSPPEVRDTMMVMSKHVLMLAYIAATSRRTVATGSNSKGSSTNPSPLFQSICQAAVSSAVSICFDNPRLGPAPSAPAIMRSDSIVDTNMELSTIEPKFDTLVRTASVSSEPRDDAVKLAASLQSDIDTIEDSDFVALAMDDRSSDDGDSDDDYLDRLAPGQNGPIFPSMPFPFPSHLVENGSPNDVLISSLEENESKAVPPATAPPAAAVAAGTNIPADPAKSKGDKGYTYTHYVKVAKWGNPRGSQPFAIGVTLLADAGLSEMWADEYAAGKVAFQNSLTWVSYPSRSVSAPVPGEAGPSLGDAAGDGAGSASRFIWSQSESDKLAIEAIKQLEGVDDQGVDTADSDDSREKGESSEIKNDEEDEDDDDESDDEFFCGLKRPSNEVFSVQSSVAFREGDIVSITLNVSPPEWVGQRAPPAQVVFARNGTDVAIFEVHCDNASALRFRPSWHGSEIANLSELIFANSKAVSAPGKAIEATPGSAFVSPVKSVGSPSYSPSSALLGIAEKMTKFSHLLDRISDVNSRLRSTLTSPMQQAMLPGGTAEDGPLLYSAGSTERPLPGQPTVRIKPITSYFEPTAPLNTGGSRQPNGPLASPPPASLSVSQLSPAAMGAIITPPSNRRLESSVPLAVTRRMNRTVRSAGKKPVSRGSSAVKNDPSDLLPAAVAPLSVSVSLGNIHSEIRQEQGLETPASRRDSVPQSPLLLFHQDKAAPGSHIALCVNIPQGGEVTYLVSSEVPPIARRPSTIAVSTARYAVTTSLSVGTSTTTSTAAVARPAPSKTAVRLPASAVERPLSLTQFSGQVLTRWDPSISDNELQFSRKDTVARRPGSVSCYPASLVPIPADENSSFALTMLLQNAPRGPNSMSIGVAKRGFRSSGSDGFGQSLNSWGLIESRASGEGKLYSNRQQVDTFRKMRDGDVFSLVYDRSLGKVWLLIAHASASKVVDAGGDYARIIGQLDTELCQEFVVHEPGERPELLFGATYCNVRLFYPTCFLTTLMYSS